MTLMSAMILDHTAAIESSPLILQQVPIPIPLSHQVQIKISASGICHTELDEIEGRLFPSKFPIILGHEIIGRVAQLGKNVDEFKEGDRVGVSWLYQACGHCHSCQHGTENLCAHALWTGKDVDGPVRDGRPRGLPRADPRGGGAVRPLPPAAAGAGRRGARPLLRRLAGAAAAPPRRPAHHRRRPRRSPRDGGGGPRRRRSARRRTGPSSPSSAGKSLRASLRPSTSGSGSDCPPPPVTPGHP